jgi:CRP-like cAMP-binding protein
MENINDIVNVDPNARARVCRKGEVLQRAGELKALTFYVKSGLLRSYIIDSKGKEHIFMFAPEGWIIADVESLEYGKAVELYIDCLEDSEVLVFEKDILFNAEVSKEMIISNAKLLYRRMGVLQRRVLMLMSAPAVDRYEYFLKAYPTLANRVPQRMIATYLGITPQALSTIRAKMAHS